MFLLIQLALFLCSFAQAEYVLYKYDGTELSVKEHRQAYQILLEQQWPTAPAFNSNYNPESDEEIEIARRLKSEIPTVYARWIPKIVYETVIYSIGQNPHRALFQRLEKTTVESSLSKNFSSYPLITDADISYLGLKINKDELMIQLHKMINSTIASSKVFNFSAFSNEKQLFDQSCLMAQNFKGYGLGQAEFLKILKLELLFKKKPNMFLLWRAGEFLPDRDFSTTQLKELKDDVSTVNAKTVVNIRTLHLYNISYGASFLGARDSDGGASCVQYYKLGYPRYGYALPLKKTDVIQSKLLFGVPPLTTFISSFFCSGELFHPRAYTLITGDLNVRQEVDGPTVELNNLCWLTDEIKYILNSRNEVIKQAALRRQYIVENAIPLNNATKKLIDGARSVYK